MPSVHPIPQGYETVTPYLIIDGATQALEFYKKAFGASEIMRFEAPGGKIGHAEIRIGKSIFMLADECPEMKAQSPKALGGSPVSLMIYVEDVDAMFNRAISAGAKAMGPIENKFYGDRMGTLTDPYGHQWHFATHIEDVSPEEMKKRMAALKK